MNSNIIELVIEVNYEQQKVQITTENLISIEELTKLVAKKLSIKEELEKNMSFYYKDEKNNNIKIEKKEDLIKISKQNPNSENVISIIYLEIINKPEINNNKENNTIILSETINENNSNSDEKKILQKKIDENEKKIKELEDTIEKMKNQSKIKNDNGQNICLIEKCITTIFMNEKNNFISQSFIK